MNPMKNLNSSSPNTSTAWYRHPTVVWFASLLFVTGLYAQPATGTLSGRVLNQGTGSYLEGVRIEVAGSDRVAYTSRDGNFQMTGVPIGLQRVSVSYAGLDPQTVSVTVASPRTEMPEIALTSSIYKLDAFVVPGEREGNALAITQQRNAPNVKNVLSTDAFGNVADENLGNFLQRLPGVVMEEQEGSKLFIKVRGIDPDLNAVTIDGTRAPSAGLRAGLTRSFEVDTIPADFIETIELTKSPTPDMDADSIGGAVNLKTKSALDRKGRTITYRFGGSYSSNGDGVDPFSNVMYSDRLGKDQRLGVMFTASFNESSRARDVSLINVWELTPAMDRPVYYYLTSHGEDAFKYQRYGTGLRLDYKLTEDLQVYVNTMYSYHYTQLHRRRAVFQSLQNRVAVTVVNGQGRDAANQVASILPGFSGPNGSGTITETIGHGFQYNQQLRDRDVRSWNLTVGGKKQFRTGLLDFNVNYAPSRGQIDNGQANPTLTGVGFRFDRSNPERGNLASFTQISGPDIRDPALRNFSTYSVILDELEDRIFGAQLNFRKDFDLAAPTYIKTGFRMRAQKPDFHINRTNYAYSGPNKVQFAEAGSAPSLIPELRFYDMDVVRKELETSPQHFTPNVVNNLQTQLQNAKQAQESVYATYIMGGLQLHRLGILAGIRVEETRIKGHGNVQQVTPAEVARRAAWVGTVTVEESLRRTQAQYGNFREASAEYRDVFPGVHFRYEFRDGLIGRASWSTSIGRPNFATIIPNDSVNYDTQVVTANNTGLKPQYANNFDLALEYYFEPAGMVSAGVFQKEISDFLYQGSAGFVPEGPNNGFAGDYAGFELNTQLNGGSARVRGLEINYQQRFSMLPGFLKGFGVYANCTWLDTKGDYGSIGNTVTQDQLAGFETKTASMGISYTSQRWNIRLQRTYNGISKQAIQADPTNQRFNRPTKPTDLNASYTINPRWSLFLDVVNVLDARLVHSYIYIPSRPRNEDGWKPLFKFGVSGRL